MQRFSLKKPTIRGTVYGAKRTFLPARQAPDRISEFDNRRVDQPLSYPRSDRVASCDAGIAAYRSVSAFALQARQIRGLPKGPAITRRSSMRFLDAIGAAAIAAALTMTIGGAGRIRRIANIPTSTANGGAPRAAALCRAPEGPATTRASRASHRPLARREAAADAGIPGDLGGKPRRHGQGRPGHRPDLFVPVSRACRASCSAIREWNSWSPRTPPIF